MATFRDIADDYSSKIRSAISETSSTKTAGYITESEMQRNKQNNVVAVLKSINADLKGYTVDGKPISDAQKAQIIRLAAEVLGLKIPENLVYMVKEASNDNFVALANYWAAFFAEIKL